MEDGADTVVVVGAGTRLGRAAVSRLLPRYRVVAFDKEDLAAAMPGAHAIRLDATRDDSVAQAFDALNARHGHHLASVIYVVSEFAGTPDTDSSDGHGDEQDIAASLQRILKALQTFVVDQFVLIGTLLIHAPALSGRPINEASPVDPKSPLRAAMIKAERLLQNELGEAPRVVLRLAPLYDDLGHNAYLARQIAAAYESRLVSMGRGEYPDRAHVFLHIDDAVSALVRAVEVRDRLPREASLLLAEDDPLTQRQLRAAVLHGLDRKVESLRRKPNIMARLGGQFLLPGVNDDASDPELSAMVSDQYEVDTSSGRRTLAWLPSRRILDALPSIVGALKHDPVAWYRTHRMNAAPVADHSPEVTQRNHEAKAAPHAPRTATDQYGKHMRDSHYGMLWAHFVNILLGTWLLTSPFVLGAFDSREFGGLVAQVTAERGLPPPESRMMWLGWSDIVSGSLIVCFATLSLSPRFSWAQWGNASIGLWLLLAPLVFWTPSAAVYNNDLIVGGLVIAFAVLVPMMPGMSMASMMDRSDLPVGWTYSPSTYLQRLPIIGLALFGFLIARQLTAYQLGHAAGVFEPFFSPDAQRNGTEAIITSAVSKAWPIVDGGLGAVSYLLEVLMGAMGGRQRWRTMPWMVAAFGIVVVPLGVVSIYFIIIQPIVIGTWCTLCLIAAAAMALMIPYTLDELVAMGQFLDQAHRRGDSVLRVFFVGGASPGSLRDQRPGFDSACSKLAASALRGVQCPWTLVACVGLGVSLMFTRLLFGTTPPLANSDHLIGALVIVIAVSAMAEVGRAMRWINVAFGAWLIVAPWIFSGGHPWHRCLRRPQE